MYSPFSQVVTNLSLVEELSLEEKLSDGLCSLLQPTLSLKKLDTLGRERGRERGRDSC